MKQFLESIFLKNFCLVILQQLHIVSLVLLVILTASVWGDCGAGVCGVNNTGTGPTQFHPTLPQISNTDQ